MNVLKYKAKIPLTKKMMFIIANEPIYLSNGDILLIKKHLKNSISGYMNFLSNPIEIEEKLNHNFRIEKEDSNEKKESNDLSSYKSDKSMNKKSRKKRKALDNGSN